MKDLASDVRLYFRIWAAFLSASFSRGLQFRSDFFFRIVMDCVYYAVNLGFFEIVLHHTQTLGNLSAEQTRIFVACFLFMDGLYMTFFSSSLWLFPDSIRKGSFDYTLIRPISPFFLTVFRDFSIGSFINFLIACVILATSLSNSSYVQEGWASLPPILFLLFLLIIGTSIMLATRLLFLIPAFWLTEVSSLRELSWSIQSIGERPSQVYPKGFRFIFTFILPVIAAFALPTEAFLFHWPAESLFSLLTVTTVFWTLLGLGWKKGVQSYSSASS